MIIRELILIINQRLVPRRYQRDYIHFFKDDGCFSKLGYQGGQQKISLADNCVYLKTCQHEIMHALGNEVIINQGVNVTNRPLFRC